MSDIKIYITIRYEGAVIMRHLRKPFYCCEWRMKRTVKTIRVNGLLTRLKSPTLPQQNPPGLNHSCFTPSVPLLWLLDIAAKDISIADIDFPGFQFWNERLQISTWKNVSSMASLSTSKMQTQPRLDLNSEALFKLSVFSIYLSPSPTVVASVLNQRLSPQPRLTTDDVIVTYLYLHDNEHPAWIRARHMNRSERELLRSILCEEGVEKELREIEVIRSVGPIGCRRTSSLRDGLNHYLAIDG